MTNPVNSSVDDVDATTPETGGRVFVTEQQRKSNLWSARKLFYDLYVAEMKEPHSCERVYDAELTFSSEFFVHTTTVVFAFAVHISKKIDLCH